LNDLLPPPTFDVEARARQTQGSSIAAVYRMIARALEGRHGGGGTLLDVGCGAGHLWPYLRDRFDRYLGADVVRFDGLPEDAEFFQVDLDSGRVPVADARVEVVVAAETIEHLENPRAFFRELTRLARPGGWVVVTTPNQLSWLSKLTLVVKNQFNAFQDSCYPAHLTALLEVDLRRMAAECGLIEAAIRYSEVGRAPATSWHYAHFLSRRLPRALSDNLLLVARKPGHSR
jgi:2-polyprenyl-3-methyl-5-hydroxy-6-metoxy-1,4-benzoquinol methylase